MYRNGKEIGFLYLLGWCWLIMIGIGSIYPLFTIRYITIDVILRMIGLIAPGIILIAIDKTYFFLKDKLKK